MNMTVRTNYFRQWRDAGYLDLVPVIPPDAKVSERSHLKNSLGKAPGIRYASGLWGPFQGWDSVKADVEQLDTWSAMGASVGLRRGTAFLLDIDAYDETTATAIEADAIAQLGPAPLRIGQWPKRALLYRADGEIKGRKVTFETNNRAGQIELPAQVVVHGIHASSGKPYQWPRGLMKFEDLTPVSPEKLNAFMDAQRRKLPNARTESTSTTDREKINQSNLAGDTELVAQAILSLPNSREAFPTYDSMILMGNALKAALVHEPALANELWHGWCEKWEGGDYNEDLTEARWRTLKPPHSVGANYIYDKADSLAPREDGRSYAAIAMLGMPAETQEDTTGLFDAGGREDKQQQADRFKLIDFDEAADTAIVDMAPPLIKGLLDQGTMSVVYGDSNVGKTFVAMDLAYHIATGGRYAGMKTAHALVVYVAMEGGRGARRRLAALRDKFKPERRPLFKLLAQPVNMRNPEVDMEAFKACLTSIGAPVGLVVIDTLSRAMAGGDENGSVDMGAFIKNVDAVRAVTSAHIMVVHHTGKDKAKGARGHSSLRAATDTELEVSEGVISATKQRDLDKAWSSPFRLEVRTLGVDADGDPVTSCTVRLDSVTAVSRREPTEGEAAVLDAIAVLCETSSRPDKGVRTKDLEAWCKDNLSSMSRDTLNQHLRGLRGKRLVSQETRGYWRPTAISDGEDLLGECEDSVFS
ncbi:AAA family ATPase [Rhizobium phaseoli]|uniref:AAA family ATPase n=1 Tax=Rhizobium phaseoli TaxID=396 RepID=UPI002552FA31|nr:AAA family ATPase [Rhizobium phaseoli]MDK4729360.1 AAA family ATPase [Rhizobium phaseoli]